jgi:hypothetical protein
MEPNDVAQILSTPVQNGESLKVEAIQQSAAQQTNIVRALDIEQRRVATLPGSQSGLVRRVQGLAAAHMQMLTLLRNTLARTQMRAPLANAQEFIIYGRVTNQAGGPAGDIDVSAADDHGAIAATTTTAEDGSFKLHISAGSTQPPASANLAINAPRTPSAVHLIAADKRKTFLVQSDTVFEVTAGQLAYIELSVPI